MSSRRANKTVTAAVVYVTAGALLTITASFGYLAQNLWSLLFVAVIIFPARWLYKRKVKLDQVEEKKREE
jgi:hypothetical protein